MHRDLSPPPSRRRTATVRALLLTCKVLATLAAATSATVAVIQLIGG
jgi:hypothetical protein